LCLKHRTKQGGGRGGLSITGGALGIFQRKEPAVMKKKRGGGKRELVPNPASNSRVWGRGGGCQGTKHGVHRMTKNVFCR